MIQVTVHGDPRPQGSKRAFVRGGKAMLVESSAEHLKTWRTRLAAAVGDAREEGMPWEGPVAMTVTFMLRRPKKPRHQLPASRPDLSKLLRAVEDELSGVWINDDSQIVLVWAQKQWSDVPGATISLTRWSDLVAAQTARETA